MSNKHFYSHLVDLNDIAQALEKLKVNEEERQELFELAHSHIHHAIMDEILSQLNDQDKKLFIDHLTADDYDAVWSHLNNKIELVEEKITKITTDLKQELHRDITETQSEED